jgi:hypothetical protein
MKNILRNSNFGFTKWCVALIAAGWMGTDASAQVTLPNYEPFNFTAGTFLVSTNQTASNWANLNSGDPINIGSGNLSYNGLVASTGNKISFDGTGMDAAKTFTQQTNGTVYCSFILNVTSLGSLNTSGGYFFGLNEGTNTTTYGATVWAKANGTGFDLGINPRSATATNTVWTTSAGAKPTNTPILVVASYSIVSGASNDVVKMWVNPNLGTTEPTANYTVTNNGTADLANLNRVFIRQDSATATPFVEMDEMRIGSTWADVTPAAVVATAPGAPTVDSVSSINQALSVGFTAGTNNGSSITNYQYSTNGTNGTFTAFNPAQTNSPLTISNLVNGTTYSLAFKAVNSVGPGASTPATNGTPYTTPAVPTVTGVTSSNRALSVAFTAGTNNGSSITNYQYSTNGTSGTFTAFNPAQTNSPLTITNLVNGVPYTLSFKAVNAAGAGSASTATNGTPYTTPEAPTSLSVTSGDNQVTIAFTAGTNNGSSITNYQYSTNGTNGTFTAFDPAQSGSSVTIAGLSNGTAYTFALKAVNAAGAGSPSTTVSGTPIAPANPTITLGSSSLASAMTTTYGAASSPQSFTLSGTALTGGLIVSAPAGFVISTIAESGYASSLNLPNLSGSVSSTTIYVRLAATTGAGIYSGNVSISGGGAATQNVATVSSTVAPKTLSITGATATNREYNGSTTIEVGGGSLSGVVEGDTVILGGSPAGTVTSAAAGTGKAVAVTGYSIGGASSGNYVLTQPTNLTVSITPMVLTVANAAVTSRAYDGTDVATITGTLVGVVGSEVVTLNGTGTFASANAGTGIAVTSTSTISGAASANYSLTPPTGLTGTITQATQTITFNDLANKVVGDAGFPLTASASSGLPLTYASSNFSVATVSDIGFVTIVGAGTSDITVSQAGNSNYLPATQTRTLTVTPAPLIAWDVNALTAYGPSPFSPTKTNVNLTVVGLARGVGIATSGTAAGNAWGGVDLQAADATSAINGGDFVTFSITPKSGYQVSFSQIPAYNIRRSGTGPTKGIWQYQKGSGSFTNIDSNSITWGAITSGTGGNTQLPIDLSGITDLQNVPSGTTVTFRIVSWGGTGNTGSWYINNIAGDDLAVMGTVSEYTAVVPSLSSFTPNFGATGSTVTISGSSLLAVTGVKFNGQSAVFTRSSDQTITATVPAGIRAGKISLIYGSPQEEVLSTTDFEPLDGSGLATVANGDGTSPYVNTAIFGKGQSHNQTLAVTVNNPIVNSAISTVRITLPSDFPLPSSPSFSLSGAGTVSVSGRALTVEGAVVTSDSPLTVTISGLSTPDTAVSTALDGNYGITVETAGANGTLASVLVSPTVYVLVPIINLRGVDTNGVPTHVGKKVAFEGVVTASGLGSTVGRTKAYVQDPSAAIYIYSAAFTSAPIQGNVYAALGTLTQFRGGTQIDPGNASNLIDRGAGVLPEPTVLTLPISSTVGERYEGSLVKVVGLSRVAGGTGWPAGVTIPMQDSAAATVDLFLQPGSTAATEPATYPATVVGILGQYAQVSPFTTGYQLQPRTQADLIFNSAPTDITLSSASFPENNPPNLVVGTLTTRDDNAAGATYAFATGAGGTDNGAFNILDNSLRATNSLDFETKSSYSVLIQVTDAGGLTFTKQFTITLTDVVEGSTYSSWRGAAPASDAAFWDYVYGATAPGVLPASLRPTTVITGENLVLTYYVRQNTLGLTVTAKKSLDLAAGAAGWSIDGVTDVPVGGPTTAENGVSVQKRTASVAVSGAKKFLKLEGVQAQ